MSSAMVERLKRGLDVDDSHVYQVGGLLDLSELAQVLRVERPDLRDPGVARRHSAALRGRHRERRPVRRDPSQRSARPSSLRVVRGDVEAFVRAAAKDGDVIGLKTTVYRTSDESPLVSALIEASEDGKQSVCLVELKARFDERRNIEWSRKLKQAGVHVVYGYPSLKIHLKATQVVRREGDGLRRYVHVGTGNYHAYNTQVFRGLRPLHRRRGDRRQHSRPVQPPHGLRQATAVPQDCCVAPYNLRERLRGQDAPRRCAKAAGDGKQARIRIKVNALTDPAIMDELYVASGSRGAGRGRRALDLLIAPGGEGALRERPRALGSRSLPRAQPGVPLRSRRRTRAGLSGSADLMPRNLDNRLELVVPVENERLRSRLSSVFDTLLADNAGAWELDAQGNWRRLRPAKGQRARQAQEVLIKSASVAAPHGWRSADDVRSTATIHAMRVGVVNVGSNTVRLLIARRNPCLEPLHEARAYLRLGDEIDRNGWISETKLRETVDCVRRYAKEAVAHGAHHVNVVITAPGRLAQNADELVAALAQGAAARVRVLAAEEEALFAFAGALACVEHPAESVAVCDSGGGSTELVVGRPDSPQWVRSIDVGSLTVRRLLPDDPPGVKAVEAARAIVRERFEGVVPPFPMAAYATGGPREHSVGWWAVRSIPSSRRADRLAREAEREGGFPQTRPRPEPRLVVARRCDCALSGAEPTRRPVRGRSHGAARRRRAMAFAELAVA